MSDLSSILPPRTILQAYRSLPEGTMVQLIQNQIIMSPALLDKHQRLSMEISADLHLFVRKNKLGTVRAAPYDVFFDESNVFQPDIIFIGQANMSKIKKDGFYGAPDLVIEILSSGSEKYDLGKKKHIYEQYGVLEYWLVNPANDAVTGYTLVNNQFSLLAETVGNIRSKLLDWRVSF